MIVDTEEIAKAIINDYKYLVHNDGFLAHHGHELTELKYSKNESGKFEITTYVENPPDSYIRSFQQFLTKYSVAFDYGKYGIVRPDQK